MTIFLVKILLIFLTFQISIAENIVCDKSHNKTLSENEIIFFESPNFPTLTNKKALNNCSLKITGNSTKKDMYLILVITNGYITGGKVNLGVGKYPIRDVTENNVYFFTPAQTLKFYFSNSASKKAEAFQGFITYEKKTTKTCLLSENKEPYYFKTENEIYYLRSSFEGLEDTSKYPNNYQQRKCLWRFVALSGYGIKVEALGINAFTTKLLVVTDSVREYITGPSTNYYNDSQIAISYDDKHGAFEAKISIFKLPKTIPTDYCIFDNKTQTWQTNPTIKYGSNIHCWQSFEILPNHELKVTVSNYIFNETGNLLQFYTDGDRFFPFQLSENKNYIFLPYSNNTVRNLTFEFKSNENVINQRFKMEFDLIECKCPSEDIIVPCSMKTPLIFSIMGRKDNFYCANLNCSFEITSHKSCPNNHISLEATFNDNRNRYDNFTLTSDIETLISLANVFHGVQGDNSRQALILPNRTTHLYFQSTYDTSIEYLDVVKFTLSVSSSKEPNRLPNIVLSDDKKFIHNQEFQLNSIVTVNISPNLPKGTYLELAYNTKKTNKKAIESCIVLYSSTDLSSRIAVQEPFLNLGSTVTIYNHQRCSKAGISFVIKTKNDNSKNCLLKNTTLYTNEKSVTMIAGPEGPCEVVILNSLSGNIVKKLWTNAENEDVILYSYSNKKHELLRFNKTTAKNYGQMTLNSKIYVMQIPTNKSVIIEPTLDDIYFNNPLFSYYETKNYGSIFNAIIKYSKNYKISENVIVNFTVLDYDLSENGYLQIIHNNLSKNLTLMEKTFIANGNDDKEVTIIYKYTGVGYRGALLNIEVLSTKNNELKAEATTTSIVLSTIKKNYEMALLPPQMADPKAVASTLSKCMGVKTVYNGSIFHADCDQKTLLTLVNTWTIKMALNVVGITIIVKSSGGFTVMKNGVPIGNLHASNNVVFR